MVILIVFMNQIIITGVKKVKNISLNQEDLAIWYKFRGCFLLILPGGYEMIIATIFESEFWIWFPHTEVL